MTRDLPRAAMRFRRTFPAACCVGLALLALAGCREEEQGRVLWSEKGVYPGERSDGPSAETLEQLNERARYQGNPEEWRHSQ